MKSIKPGSETESLYQAARSRGASDWLIGVNGTMAVSALYGVNGVLSVGRVQTPTLKLVVDRDRVIENFKPQDYFVLKARFSFEKEAQFWTMWKAPESVLDGSDYCLDKQIVESVAAKVDDEPGVVQSFKEAKKKQKSPVCFSLSALQKKQRVALAILQNKPWRLPNRYMKPTSLPRIHEQTVVICLKNNWKKSVPY